jgi:diguanylate cyclase (GGDEF)-like protein/PAS domain S-box-containing protein
MTEAPDTDEAHFRAVAEAAPDAIISADAEDRIVFWNPAAERIFGYTAAEAIGQPVTLLMPPEYQADHSDGLTRVARGGAPRIMGQMVEVEGLRKDGSVFPIEMSLSRWQAGGRQFFTSVIRDISERRRAEQAQRDEHVRLRLMLQQVPAIVWSTDLEFQITSSSGAALDVLGLGSDQLVGTRLTELVGTENPDSPAIVAHRRAVAGHSMSYELSWSGRIFQTFVEPLRDANGAIRGTLGISLDITERKALEEQLSHQAFHDPLTGLANRALFRDRVEHALSRASRGDHVAVLFLDLDDFKAINDSFGHSEGDRLLVAVTARLLSATRGSDTVARLGGDEFAVLLEGMVRECDAMTVVERIIGGLRAPVALEGREVHVSASIGVVHANGTESADELLRNADVAMYRAKESGKGRCIVFEPAMHVAVLQRLELGADLRGALERDELRLVYQPIVELATGRMTGVEALLRWHHPERGVVPPATFIPIAEETGLIVPIGRWVVREACRQLRQWELEADDATVPAVSINISGRQLQEPTLPGEIAAILAETGVDPRRVVFEITEGVVMEHTEETVAALHALKELGVSLAIDDFGTGYSSLSYLQRFPIDILKIDKTFVDGVGQGGSDAVLARTIIALGGMLHLRLVAEGVELKEQHDHLNALGCHLGQGYLFARPLTAARVQEMLHQGAVPLAPVT